MIGLLLKDLLCLKKVGAKMGIVLGIYIVIFVASGNIGFLGAIIILILTMLSMNTFAYDELAKWDYYALSLPVTKRQIVLSKYLLVVFFDFSSIIIVLLIYLVKNLINIETILSLCAMSASAIIMAAVFLPLLYKLGTQKARIWMILIILLPTAGLMLLAKFKIVGTAGSLAVISDSTIELLIYLAVPVALLLLVGSYFLSCKIFEKKEI